MQGRVASFSPPTESFRGTRREQLFMKALDRVTATVTSRGYILSHSVPGWEPHIRLRPKPLCAWGWASLTGKPPTRVRPRGRSAPRSYISSAYGNPAGHLQDGMPTPPASAIYDAGLYPRISGTLSAPPVAIDHNAGRPPRQIQWSIGIQREIFTNLAVEVSYVGNRGAWWEGNDLINVNALTAERIAARARHQRCG